MKSCMLLDMGGVVLRVGTTEGLPKGRLDWRGRQALVAAIRSAGGRVDLEQLDPLLFRPWEQEHARRHELGRDADWQPHLDRLREAAGVEVDRWELLDAWFRPYADQLAPEEGARGALAELREMGYRLAVVSNVPLPGAFYRRVLERHDLLFHFESLHFSYDSGTRKPSPALVRQALAALGVPPAAAYMVGDRRSADVAAGRAAGVETVWIESAFSDGPEPDHAVGSLAEFPALLRAIGVAGPSSAQGRQGPVS